MTPAPSSRSATGVCDDRTVYDWTGLCLSMDPATADEAGGKVTQDTCPK
ncbi:hypothetical protein ACU4GG_39670 [Streptomyces nojiriensis]